MRGNGLLPVFSSLVPGLYPCKPFSLHGKAWERGYVFPTYISEGRNDEYMCVRGYISPATRLIGSMAVLSQVIRSCRD